jgi:hypothetical protein
MVRVRYVPLPDPPGEAAKLRPAIELLESWRDRYHPASAQFWAIVEAKSALKKVRDLLDAEPR